MSGRGTWFDAEGEERHERNLVVLSVDPDECYLSADLAVFHEIWGHFDFRGSPHAEIYNRNAQARCGSWGTRCDSQDDGGGGRRRNPEVVEKALAIYNGTYAP